MEISIRVAGGVATGKTTLLKKIENLIRKDYKVTISSSSRTSDSIPEEILYMELVCPR